MAQAILFNQADNPLQTCANSYENRSVAIQNGLLRDIGNARAGLHLQGAVIGLFHAAQNFEHGGFTRAVATDQADALLGFKRKVSVIEKRDVPKCQLGVK